MLSPESGSPTSEVKKRLACPDFPVHCYICAAEAADFLPQSELLSKPFSASLAIDECDAPLSANRIRKAPQCEQRKSVKDTLLDENRPTQHTRPKGQTHRSLLTHRLCGESYARVSENYRGGLWHHAGFP